MTILLLGGGGREHALAWKMKQSALCSTLFIAPGNPGTSSLGQNIALPLNDFQQIANFCLNEQVNMLVVGPEEPLVLGIYDYFQQPHLQHIQLIGPSKKAAQLEGSKAFAKEFMQKFKIPTAGYQQFDASNFEEGLHYLQQHALPIVLKADGLAAGKGVVICTDKKQAIAEFTAMIQEAKFGQAGSKVVVEEFLEGIECSFFVLTDGQHYVLLPDAKDYKRIGEKDTGLNTGGMGAISPVPFVDQIFTDKVIQQIILPTLKGIQEDKLIYKGFIFIGLIKVNNEPFVIEYNCRMGDPETETVMPRLENDLLDLLCRVHDGTLHEVTCSHSSQSSATVMLVSKGYPEDYEKNKEITLPESEEQSLIFHAGTKLNQQQLETAGGRVLAITSIGENLQQALDKSYSTIEHISFDGKTFRSDIGWEFKA
ncbi:MAG: phosphoribosylamine--glycine ligase [Chitinophagaceae bacterium]|nr:phosphoribosylamine--glycine ligase [Chitinophagaceae bacterium]